MRFQKSSFVNSLFVPYFCLFAFAVFAVFAVFAFVVFFFLTLPVVHLFSVDN